MGLIQALFLQFHAFQNKLVIHGSSELSCIYKVEQQVELIDEAFLELSVVIEVFFVIRYEWLFHQTYDALKFILDEHEGFEGWNLSELFFDFDE